MIDEYTARVRQQSAPVPTIVLRIGVPGKVFTLPRLAELREKKWLSQHELAKQAGIARSTLARLESGEPARRGTVRKLAEVLGVEPGEIAVPSGE